MELLRQFFLDNPAIPEQVCQFCQENPEYIQAREEYAILVQEWEHTMGQAWYFTFECALNQYWALENQAYYLFGLHLRQELLKGFQETL